MARGSTIASVDAQAYEIPTETPESDGTLEWDSTTLVVCEVEAGGETGIGYTYASAAAVEVIREQLAEVLIGRDPGEIRSLWLAQWQSIRNYGRPGVCSMAISAVDIALWDLYARRLGQPLYRLLGPYRNRVEAYGSGGFTSYSEQQLRRELACWCELDLGAAKIKIGRDRAADLERLGVARETLGPERSLYVDANGAYARREALEIAAGLGELGVSWFEEPITSDDVAGMRWLRDRAPALVRITSGEYCYQGDDFQRFLSAEAVDVIMADATRCAGVTGFLEAAALAGIYHVPLSSHCAPTLHAHLGCAARTFVTAEYFYDHVRIENRFFDGAIEAGQGYLTPDPSRPGLGITVKRPDLQRYAA